MKQERNKIDELCSSSQLPTKATFVHFEEPPLQRTRSNTMPYNLTEFVPLSPSQDVSVHTPTTETPTTPSQEDLPTSVMLRNIHNEYSPKLLLEDILNAGFKAKMDFFYMPVDMASSCNLGYCFLNFTTHANLIQFRDHFDGKRLPQFPTHKVCAVSIARVQGLQANLDHLSKSAAIRTLPEEYKPTIFNGETASPYPPATDAPRVVRTRPHKRNT